MVITYQWVARYLRVVKDLKVVRYLPWYHATHSTLMVIMYQGVVKYPTNLLEHADTNSSKLMRQFWQTTHYTRPINKPTCTLIKVFSSKKVFWALWPIRMEYFATDLSGYVPLMVGPANYEPVRMNSSFDFLIVSANQCSTYMLDGWLYMYSTDGHVLSSVFILTNGWWYRRTDGHTDGWVTRSYKPLRILHSCIPIRKKLVCHAQRPYSTLVSSLYEKKSPRSWGLNSKSSLQGKTLHSRDLGWLYSTI